MHLPSSYAFEAEQPKTVKVQTGALMYIETYAAYATSNKCIASSNKCITTSSK